MQQPDSLPDPPEPTPLTYVEIIAVALIWGAGAVAIKVAVEGFPPLTASGMRLWLASLLYVPLLWLNRRSVHVPRPSDLPVFAWLALTGFVVFNLLYFGALTRTTASHGVLVWGAQPIVTAVLAALLLGERVPARAIGGVLVSMAGVALIVGSSLDARTAFGADALGDLMLIALMVCWVLYTVSSRKVMARFSPLAATGWSCLVAAVLVLPVSTLGGFEPGQLAAACFHQRCVAILFSSWASVVLSYILWNRALLRLGPTRTAVFVNLSPVFGLGLAWLIEGETLAWVHLAGAVLIIGGVLGANLRFHRRPAATDAPVASRPV
jgi:drug/metabolite transporter (DMT)-like permease